MLSPSALASVKGVSGVTMWPNRFRVYGMTQVQGEFGTEDSATAGDLVSGRISAQLSNQEVPAEFGRENQEVYRLTLSGMVELARAAKVLDTATDRTYFIQGRLGPISADPVVTEYYVSLEGGV